MPNKRAEGIEMVPVPMHRTLKGRLRTLAREDGEDLAPWIRHHLRNIADKLEARRAKKAAR